MLRKIIAIRNVGRFHNSAAPGNQQLAKHTLIAGANGYGKTTICAVLRSLQTGEASHVLGRTTLGSTEPPSVELLLENGQQARFTAGTWNAPQPEIAIFDGTFVAENVHSGEIVEIEHKRNLYRVIVGANGVALAAEDTRLAAESRTKTGEIGAAAKAIQPHVPAGMTLEQFIRLPSPADGAATAIEAQECTVKALRQAETLRARPGLTEFVVPPLPADLAALLTRTLDDVAQDAEAVVAGHLAAHGMEGKGGWIAEGLEHAGPDCPFCDQSLEGVALIAAYRAVFSKRYTALSGEIAAMQTALSDAMGDVALARMAMVAEQNAGALEFWRPYCPIDGAPLSLPADAAGAIRAYAAAAAALLARKAGAPLEPVTPGDGFAALGADLERACAAIAAANKAIRDANTAIGERKAEADAGNLVAAEFALARLKAIGTRHRADVGALCDGHTALVSAKESIETRKSEVRARLDTHTASVVRPYEQRINELLEAFNAGFRIAETKHAYPGGLAASSYQLVINATAVQLGDGKTPTGQPSFKNTLSAGDRTTLALAFFLAHLERDPAAARTLAVFDDPFNSQDAFRRRQTVNEIMKIAGRCGQVIVLSHDATFLKQVWDKAPAAERIAMTIADHRALGSKITVLDLDAACRGRNKTELDDLQTFLTTGAGVHRDLIKKMRIVLETHLKATYPGSFAANDWLGDMVRKIREGGAAHPAAALYGDLDQINDYSAEHHHGEDTGDATPDQIDPNELTGFTRQTLQIANALQG